MSPPGHERRVRIELGARAYDVIIAAGLLQRSADTARELLGAARQVCIAHDAAVPQGPISRARESFEQAGFRVHLHPVRPCEQDKSLAQAEEILRVLSDLRFERRDCVLALGGGITGDLAGFAAAIYMRGIPWIQCPTTLLSMVDASVGGKTGVNLAVGGDLRKNMAGVIHQPLAVIADIEVLSSLPERDFRCGLAECVKHGMLSAAWGDPGLMDWMQSRFVPILRRDPEALSELIARNIAVKAAVVRADEREDAPDHARMQLNLGHTFAHAIEGSGAHLEGAPIRHGEAVALGLMAACACAAAADVGKPDTAAVRSLLERASLPTGVAGLPESDRLVALMRHDKKAEGGRIRLVLPTAPGICRVFDDIPERCIRAAIDAVRA